MCSCSTKKQTNSTFLSIIVLTDTVVAYEDKIGPNSHLDSLLFDEKILKDFINHKKLLIKDSLIVLIKLTGYGSSLGNSIKLFNWCKQIDLDKFKMIDVDSIDGKFFELNYNEEQKTYMNYERSDQTKTL